MTNQNNLVLGRVMLWETVDTSRDWHRVRTQFSSSRICVLEDAYASPLYEEKYSNAFFIPREYKFLVLTSEIFCLWGKQKSLVLAGLGIYKFIEKNKFLKIYTNFWRTHMRPRWRICITRRGRICVLGDAYAGSTELCRSLDLNG